MYQNVALIVFILVAKDNMTKTVSFFFIISNWFIMFKCLKNIFFYRVCSVNSLADAFAKGIRIKIYSFT